ncbi:hypothetical protein ACFPM7_15790 [Actinokineospora guangxiensis]|uniref:ABC transporter n=1 Tax=Actinokineospora guangxiensis TaxID=1490288 RepID=A0ABW0EQA6_9PSEU
MRWPLLYARSHRVPAAALTAVAGIGLLGLLARAGENPQIAALAAAVGAAALTTGLSGTDPALDRTAAFSWPPRRALHLLLGTVFVAGAVLLLAPVASGPLLLRDVVGLVGAGALGAVVFGAEYAWLLPITWAASTLLLPADDSGVGQVLTWPVQPAGTPVATVTAAVLGCAGLLAQSALGARRHRR